MGKNNTTKNRLKSAEDALLAIMADESLADSLPSRIVKKIDKWDNLRRGA
jgi:hypothetical protein